MHGFFRSCTRGENEHSKHKNLEPPGNAARAQRPSRMSFLAALGETFANFAVKRFLRVTFSLSTPRQHPRRQMLCSPRIDL
jgi:hypothetical protein